MLQRNYIQSDKLGPLCQRISYGLCEEYESFLRSVLKSNPHRDVRGSACLAMAHFLNSRDQRLDLVSANAGLVKEFCGLFGQDYFDRLQQQNRDTTDAEIESLLQTAIEQYAEVRISSEHTVGDRAQAELFEIRHLVVGKTAPDIEGVDEDGQPFKLSDYHGKVILLDFWSQV